MLGTKDVERFLSHLTMEKKLFGSTQCQALNALVFLYKDVLHRPFEGKIAHIRSKIKKKVPTVLTQAELAKLLGNLEGLHALMAKVLYGRGFRSAS